MANLVITLDLVATALENFQGRSLDLNTVKDILADVDRLRRREDFVPPPEAASLAATFQSAEQEARNEEGGDEPTDLDRVDTPEDAPKDKTPRESRPRVPRPRMQTFLVVLDDENKLKGIELMGWAVECPESDPVDGSGIPGRVMTAVNAHNSTKRGRKDPVTTVPQAMERMPKKFWRVAGSKRLNETRVLLVPITSNIPGMEAQK